MSLYPLFLFLHVSGAIGAFVSLGIWLFGLSALRRSQRVEQVRAIAWLIIVASPLMVGSVVLIGLAGFRMALSTWDLSTPWIAVSLGSVVLIGPIGACVLDPRMRAIMAMAREAADGPLPAALSQRTHDPILVTAASTLATMLLGNVFLMTTKPQLFTSILVMGLALLLGLIVSLLSWYVFRSRARSVAARMHQEETDPFLRKTIWTRRW
jgi:Predicted integral membrane protein (DUF2269)